MIVVTGATGFLGEHVCSELIARGYRVRAFARTDSERLRALGCEFQRGDVLSAAALDAALPGATAVFHLAGLVSRSREDTAWLMRLHIDGTRQVLDAMRRHGIRRMILASTSGSIAASRHGRILDEACGAAEHLVGRWPYYASKIYQERLAFDLGTRLGIEVVAVNPSLLLGPGDRRLSSTGDVQRFLLGQLPAIPCGGLNFADVRDVAVATVNALERGTAKQRYLLGGPNWTFDSFFLRLSRVSGVRGPRLRLPSVLQRWGATALEELHRLRGTKAPVDRISAEMSELFWWFDSSKAVRELGFAPRDPMLTLQDTVAHLRRVPERVSRTAPEPLRPAPSTHDAQGAADQSP